MRRVSACLILLSFLLFVGLNDARKDPGEYWRSVMNNEPMPREIKSFLHQDLESESKEDKDHFIKNFSTELGYIIYHTHPYHKDVKILEH